jgi:hypothetical protein
VTLSPEYRAYLRSQAWQQTREKAFEHYGRRCAVCNTKWRLQVHHLTYERLGHEYMSDLRILCWRHHKKGRYSAVAINMDAKAVWWLRLLERLTTGIFRAIWACVKLTLRLLRALGGVLKRRHRREVGDDRLLEQSH